MTAKSDSSLSLEDIQKGFNCVAANVVKKAAEEYVALLKSGKTKEEAMEKCSQSRFVAAKVHTYGYMLAMFKEAIEEMEDRDSNETKVLETLCRLFGLWVIEEQQGYFLKCECSPQSLLSDYDGILINLDGYFSAQQMDKVQEQVDTLCAETRSYAGK